MLSKKIGVLLVFFFVIFGLYPGVVTSGETSEADNFELNPSLDPQEEDHDIRIMKPLISVPKIQERSETIEIWVRNPIADENTPWEAALLKEYSNTYMEEYDMDIIDIEEAEDRKGEDNWYLTAVVPEDAREELYDLRVSDGEVNAKSIQSVDVVDEINDQFSFVSAPDTHIGYVEDGEPAAVNRFRQFVHEMNLVRPDFVTLEGDISDKEPLWWADQDPYPTEQDEKVFELLQELEVPVYVVHGNHDYSYTSDDNPNYNIESYREWINPHLNYTFTYGEDYHFTMQNSGKYVSLINSDGRMTMENVTWMEKVLEENQDKTMRFVHQHHPVYPDTLDDGDVTDAFRETVIDQNVTAVFAGHVHTNRDIYDAQGNEIPGDPTEGEQPLHVSTGDLVKSVLEYRLVRIDGDEIESMTYDLDGDGERDDKAGIPLGDISVDYTPANDGTNSEVVATIENELYEDFDDAVVKFNLDSPEPGQRYFVENATPFEKIDTGEEKHIYVRTDLDRDSTYEVSVREQHFIETLPASDVGLRSATLRGRLPDLGEAGEVFFRYREYGEDPWVETPPQSKVGPQNFSVELSDLDPLQKYEFKAGIEVGWQGEIIEEWGATNVFVPAELSRTLQIDDDWTTYYEFEGLEVSDHDLVLEPPEDYLETLEFIGESETISVANTTHLEVELLGAGGGGPTGTGTRGGDGGRVQATLDVSQFDEITIWVGEGGEGAEGSSDYGEGGWGRHRGGDGYDASDISLSRGSGGGGGSTEIVADDGTFLAAADAGGGGGYDGSSWTFGGGGGARGGLGGEHVDEPAEGEGYGGHGGDPDGHVHGDPNGQPGGGEVNEDYVVGEYTIEIGGGNDGGPVTYDGDHGEVQVKYEDTLEDGYRISDPLSLDSVAQPEESVIYWNSTEPADTEIKVFTAITESDETLPSDWNETVNGEPIPGIEGDISGMYLWNMQLFLVNETRESPRLHSISEAIVETPETDFELYELRVEPENIYVDEEMELKVEVENHGYGKGDHTVEFYVDSDPVGSDTVTVESGEVETAVVVHSEEEPGTYMVEVESLSNEFTVHTLPDVEAIYADEVTLTSAELHGELTNIGMEESVNVFFRYREEGGEWSETTSQSLSEESVFYETVELQEERAYEFKAVVEWDDMEVVSESLSFSTSSYFELDILYHDELVYVGEAVSLEYRVSNIEDARDTQEILFEVYENGEVIFNDSETVELEGGEDEQAFFTWETDGAEVGAYDLILTSEDDEEEVDVELIDEEEETFSLEIMVDGEGTTDPKPGSHVYKEGEEVVVEATSGENWEFSHWTGDVPEGNSEEPEITVVMDEDRSLTAYFESIDPEVEYELTIEVEGEGETNLGEGTARYNEGQLILLKAFPAEGWEFRHWTGDVPEGEEEEIEITIRMDNDRSVTAHFVEGANFVLDIISPEDGDEFERGEDITVEYQVVNTGGYMSEQRIELFVDGELIETEENVLLGPEEVYEGEFTWRAEEEGDIELEVRSVDDEDAVESTAEVTISVVEEGQVCSWWWILIVLIAAVLIAALVLARKKDDEEVEDEEVEDEEVEDEEDDDEDTLLFEDI